MKKKAVWCKTPSREERMKRLRETIIELEKLKGYDYVIGEYRKELKELENF